MNKYRFLLLLFLVYSALHSQQQGYSFGYRLEYMPDSTDVMNTKVEDFTLFIDKGKSYFVSDNYLKRDSILNAAAKTQGFNFAKAPNTHFKSVIIKENDKINFYDNILKYYFAYTENVKFKWNIEPEKQKIGEYNVQKAFTEYGGRKWTAWFTQDIPVHEGPYKFRGLPGLIIKIEDSGSNYRYELISVKKKNLPINVIFSEKYLNQHKILSKEEYRSALKNINDNIINEASSSGITIAPESVEQAKKDISKRNNPIELTLN
ncbi:GLPGLI family protein [Chryseobacterium rhizoplanae]|uniref:GLPGLI family protein n=1 Tax=Chryseobacterium rhizoplanae TaxID=1609531 RepID=UPI001CE328C7|nr:GLPGLI family protein [Chryseobacterium rhizoplanae]UCA61020.1 GLPGLI family protein [Chryseobacterium rhizoplanae]